MPRKILCLVLAAAAVTLTTTAEVRAWGAYHVGYTHVGPYGVQHYGRTVGVGPYGGVYSGGRYGAYGYDRYGGVGAYGGAYHYSYGADRYGSYDRYAAYRRW